MTSHTHEQFYTDRNLRHILQVGKVTHADKDSQLDLGYAKMGWT